MARHFVGLKLALLRGRLRQGVAQVIGVVVGLAVVVPLAAGAALGMAVLGRATDHGPDVAVLVMAASALLWTVGPPLLFGVDETLDPGRLALLPLTRRRLATGLVAASLVGIGPLATILLLLGVVVGLAPPGPGAVVVVAAAVVHLLVCLLAGRAVTTALSAWLRSRRGRDLVGIVLTLGIVVLAQLPNLLTTVLADDADAALGTLQRLADVVGLSPFGWAGRAAAAGAQGQLLPALGWLAAAAALAAALAAGWMAALDRITTTPEVHVGGHGAGADLFGGLLSRLPPTRLGATAAKELRYLARDPRHRLALIVQVAFSLVLVVAGTIGFGRDPRVVLLAAGVVLLFGLGTLNAFGVDGPATWLLVTVGGDHRADLAGKNLALAMIAVPVGLVAALGVAAVTGGWVHVPVAVAAQVGLLLIAMGVGDVASVLFPFPQPDPGQNVFGAQSGAGFMTGMLQMVAFSVMGALMLPIIGGGVALLLLAPGWLWVLLIVAPAYGALIWRGGVRVAADELAKRGPDLVAALQPD